MYPSILDSKIADALIDERRRLAKDYKTLDSMLKYMDVEDVEPVLTQQQKVETQLAELAQVLAILN
jgi:hypothetical protein